MTDLAERDWRVIAEKSGDGPTNMALDEIAAGTAASGGPRTLRVYRWEPSTLSLGFNQDPDTVDWEFCEREGITVTRRQTGGGAIYHDSWGDISYSIVVPAEEVPGNLVECYQLLCEPILAAFDRMGVDADFAEEERPAISKPVCYLRALHPAHDVVGPDGRKISGNAQYRQRDAVVQHGSLTFATTPERHCACFTDRSSEGAGFDPVDFSNRVAGIEDYADVDRDTAVDVLCSTLAEWAAAESGAWTDDELADARNLVERKYATDLWTREGEVFE